MPIESTGVVLAVVAVVAAVVVFAFAATTARSRVARAHEEAERLLTEARQEAENKAREIVLAGREQILALEEENGRVERELQERESRLETRQRKLDRDASELGQRRSAIERQGLEADGRELETRKALQGAEEARAAAQVTLEKIAGLSADEARAELIATVEDEARKRGAALARKIEDQAREAADRQAAGFLIRACQQANVSEVLETTVSFIELPSDEMKGRIIGREGRNIRSLEMATGIDLIVDDTPRSILISSFDPLRREVARISIGRLVEDGRIHPGRIEEVVAKVREELDVVIEEKGAEAVYGLGISDLHPKLVQRVGRMRYHLNHGQNLLQHCLETALIGGHMAREIGARPEIVERAGLLHELGLVEDNTNDHPIAVAAELCARYGEHEDVVHAIRSLVAEADARSVEATLLNTANRLSENRPGARKDNLNVFVERLKRLESLALEFEGVDRVYAVKAGKEIRVLLDAGRAQDRDVYDLCKKIARKIERELAYPGQIKVTVIRETRSVRFAL